ncbi:putative transmembrane protein [Cryptosporidium felis]|nr:putative transmembrane protein [Cryptosporidium felis]
MKLIIFWIVGFLLTYLSQYSECLQVKTYINFNETSLQNQKLKEIRQHLTTNSTTNSTVLNEEVLDNTIEELTDLSNEIETKLKELKKRELIMDIDKKNIGVFASITMIALVLLFYLGVAHMEDALKDASILHGDTISPRNVIFDPRW